MGYPDFRRQIDYDTTAPYITWSAFNAFSTETFGPFNLGNFAYLSGRLSAPATGMQFDFQFYEDPALTVFCGRRLLRFDPAGVVGGNFRIPALGRYVLVVLSTAGAVNVALTGMLQGSNRPTANEIIPEDAILTAQNNIFVGLGATVTAYALSMASGRATMSFSTVGQPGKLVLQGYQSGFTYVPLASVRLAAASDITLDVTLPLTQVRVLVTNTGAGNDNYTAALVVDTSGG